MKYLFDSHPNDSRIVGPCTLCPTIAQRWGTGGNNTPLVLEIKDKSDERQQKEQQPKGFAR